MFKPPNSKNSSPYQKIDQKVNIPPHNKYIYPIESQTIIKDEFKKCQYESNTNNNNKRAQSIPIRNKNKDNIVQLKNRQNKQNAEQYFEKQLNIRILQSKKLLQQLQQTQKNLLKIQKQSWMIKNDYESQKRKNEKLQRQNTRLIQQISTLEDKLKQVSRSIGNKVEEDKSYLENLQSLKSQIEEKQRIIDKLTFQNTVLAKSKLTVKKQTEIKEREGSIQSTKNSYAGKYILNMNRTIDFQKVLDLQSTNKSLFLQPPQASLDIDWTKNKQRKQKHQIYIPNRDFRADYILNSNPNNLFTKQNYTIEPRGNYHSNESKSRSSNILSTKNPSHQKYLNNSLNYLSKNERKYSCDYVGTNHSLRNIIPIPYHQQKLTSRRNRRDKTNNTIIQRCKMMLNY